jgi:hypothetical protein
MASLIIEVTPEIEQRLRDQAAERGMPLDAYLQTVLEALAATESSSAPLNADTPVLKLFEQIWEGVPDEEWERLPSDLAEQHDHYIYGLPKRTE